MLLDSFQRVQVYNKYSVSIPYEVFSMADTDKDVYLLIEKFVSIYYPNLSKELLVEMLEYCKAQEGDIFDKISKTFFVIKFSHFLGNPYSSHMELLLAALCKVNPNKTIAEIGCGGVSSSILGTYTRGKAINLISVDVSPEWFEKRHINHSFLLQENHEDIISKLQNEDLSLVFIDGHNRYEYFKGLVDFCDFMVIHDTDMAKAMEFPDNWLDGCYFISDTSKLPHTVLLSKRHPL